MKISNNLVKNIRQYRANRRRRKSWQRLVTILGCIVAFCTTYALILPAITVEISNDPNVLFCGVEDHEHSLQCLSNPNADVEQEDDWQRMVARLGLTGNRKQDAVTVAKSQLGYAESTKNYQVDTDGSKQGYTRYGAWLAQPYADWNTSFISWCFDYAGISPEVLQAQSDCAIWLNSLKTTEFYRNAQNYVPMAGDLIFVDENADGQADRTGIVTEIATDAETNMQTICVVEGDCQNAVATQTYLLNDNTILGYKDMSKTLEAYYHTVPIYTTETYEYQSNDNTKITIEGLLPTGATPKAYPAQVEIEGQNVLCAYDITIFREDGSVFEPGDSLKVSFDSEELRAKNDNENQKQTAAIYYVPEEGEPEQLGSEITITGISFETDHFSIYAATEGPITAQDSFYKKINSLADLQTEVAAGRKFVIVSANGGYVLTDNTTTNYTAVSMMPVNANHGWFSTEDGAITNTMTWTLSGSGSSYTVRGSSRYLYLSSNAVLSTSSRRLTFAYTDIAGSWTIRYSSNYYLYNQNGSFSSSTSTSNTYYRNMTIYAVYDNHELTIPDYGSEGNGSGSIIVEEKPTYAPYIDVSAAKKGTAEVTAGTKHKAWYYSDPSTSQIESWFSGITTDDGKLATDKSVIYGEDDYGAFASYKTDEFSITMSALSQQYRDTTVVKDKPPVDIVLVMDVSGSMETTMSDSLTRTQVAVEAANYLINEVMRSHGANRVGVAVFSTTSAEFLPLGRYYYGSGTYNGTASYSEDTIPEYIKYEADVYNNSNGRIYTDSSLKQVDSSGNMTSLSTREVVVYGGTYTQSGIARAYEMFSGETNTTYQMTTGEVVDYTPVMLLLSDGEPTLSTSNYADVLSGPHYGSGVAVLTTSNDTSDTSSNNPKGIHGYNTILSGNYYKYAISDHYDNQAYVYTIGMGIYKTGVDNSSGTSNSQSGDHYKRAVLNPSAENIEALTNTSATNYKMNALMLYNLLNNNVTNKYIPVVSATWTDSTLNNHTALHNIGTTNANIQVVRNYYTDYNYTDDAYFNDTYDPELLKQVIKGYVAPFLNSVEYIKSFTTPSSGVGDIVMNDYIGKGMETTSDFVLRYEGKNYVMTLKSQSGNQKLYAYTGADMVVPAKGSEPMALSECEVRVTTETDGTQIVQWIIPGKLIPEYSPNASASWFYEMLPVRLMYKVGLTEEAKAQVEALTDGETLIFYTNAWSSGGENALASFTTSAGNPYYLTEYADSNILKTENTTTTRTSSFESAKLSDTQYQHIMGNNGKLIFGNGSPDENGEMVSFTVTKAWQDAGGNDITPTDVDSIVVNVLTDGKNIRLSLSIAPIIGNTHGMNCQDTTPVVSKLSIR